MTSDVIAAVIAVALTMVGVLGIVIPVLPGSLTILGALLVWGLWGDSTWGWLAFGLGAAFVAVGMASSWILTGRALKQREIPQWPVIVGLVAGVLGMFVLPGLGFILGFIAGVMISEYLRVRDFGTAVTTSWAMVKAVGVGILVELTCGLIAATVLALGIISHFTVG